MAKIYIAAKYSAKERVKPYKEKLFARGHKIYSTWLDSSLPLDSLAATSPPDENKSEAKRDLDEVYRCDTFILDTIDESATGGREVELGYAMDGNRAIYIVGPRRNVFHFLIKYHYETWEELLNALEENTKRGD